MKTDAATDYADFSDECNGKLAVPSLVFLRHKLDSTSQRGPEGHQRHVQGLLVTRMLNVCLSRARLCGTPTTAALTIVAVLFANALIAQDFVDIARVHYAGSSINKFDSSASGSRLDEIGLDLTVPIVLNDRFSVLTGGIYEGIKTQLYADKERESIQSFTLKAGFNWKHNDKWSGTYVFLPKVASDFKNPLTRQDFQFGAIALLKYNYTNNIKYKFGIYGNTELFGPWVVPIFGLYYLSPTKKFEANFTLPLAADINYKLSPLVHVGANFFGLVRTYNLTEGVAGSDTGTGYVARSTNELFTYLRVNLGKTSILQFKVGASLGRSYRVYYDFDKVDLGIPLKYFGDDRNQVNVDFEDGLIGQVVYIFRVSTK
jgi:hypothetical protein